MLHKNGKGEKITQLFFDFPLESFYLREISRKTGVAITSVKRYVNNLIDRKLVVRISRGIYPSFKSNRDSDDGVFRFYKRINSIEKMQESGLLDFIEDKCNSKSIILFGSASRGEDIERSDIDLFVQSKKTDLDTGKYEKTLKRKINLFFEANFSRLNKELKNNILNGIILRGYLGVF